MEKLLDRAQHGDKKAMEELRPVIDAAPQLFQRYGDLAASAELSLINVLSGKDALIREMTRRKLEALRAELAAVTPLETLLVARIASCWLALAYSEANYYQNLERLTWEQGEYHQKRIDHANKRYLAAIKALAVVRRLQLPALQVNLIEKQLALSAPGRLELLPPADGTA